MIERHGAQVAPQGERSTCVWKTRRAWEGECRRFTLALALEDRLSPTAGEIVVLLGAVLMVTVAWLGWQPLGAGTPAALSAGVAAATAIAALLPVALLSL